MKKDITDREKYLISPFSLMAILIEEINKKYVVNKPKVINIWSICPKAEPEIKVDGSKANKKAFSSEFLILNNFSIL